MQNLFLVCRRGGWSAALNKVEHYGVQRVTGDGRCMFRALVSCSIISFRARSLLMESEPLLLESIVFEFEF